MDMKLWNEVEAGDTNLGVFRTLVVSKARKLNQIIRE